MRRLGGKHVVQQEVCHIEQSKDSLPAHVHGYQLAAHHISKVLDHPETVELTCSHRTSGAYWRLFVWRSSNLERWETKFGGEGGGGGGIHA